MSSFPASGCTGHQGEFGALLLGALCVISFAPFHIFPLSLLSLALLFTLWRMAATPRRAAWLGFLWGLGCFLGGVSWVYVSMHDVGGMPAALAAIATLLFCATLALFPALAGGLFGRWRCGSIQRDAWLAAAAWMLGEWLRGWVLSGFPWLSIGYSQSPSSPLSGYAAVLGVYGIGFIVAGIAAIAAFSWRAPTPAVRQGVLLTAALFSVGYLLQQMSWTLPSGPPLTVSLLQGNIEQSTKWNRDRLENSLRTYARLVRQHPAQLIVLPETALPMFLEDVPKEYLQTLTRDAPILTGAAVSVEHEGKSEYGGYANAAVALSSGARAQAYTKSHLVPFGEYVPMGFSWFLGLMHMPMSDFTSGPAYQPPLELVGQKIAPNICYEDLFGEEIIHALPQATLLINLSNTAWFGDSLAQPQHLQIAQMRALETGRSMLRATNTGMTAAIDRDGRIIAALPAFTSAGLTVEVQGYTGMTPYARWGNLLALLLAVGALLPAWHRRRQQDARSTHSTPLT
jgi:apolipoprotein N-acyltransferase